MYGTGKCVRKCRMHEAVAFKARQTAKVRRYDMHPEVCPPTFTPACVAAMQLAFVRHFQAFRCEGLF